MCNAIVHDKEWVADASGIAIPAHVLQNVGKENYSAARSVTYLVGLAQEKLLYATRAIQKKMGE